MRILYNMSIYRNFNLDNENNKYCKFKCMLVLRARIGLLTSLTW